MANPWQTGRTTLAVPFGMATVAGLLIWCAASVASAADRGVASRAAESQSSDAEADKPAADSKQHIDELIRQLGNPRFTVRRTAANELDKIGPEAFDQLYAATGDADPEVAASARYVLRQITKSARKSCRSSMICRTTKGSRGSVESRGSIVRRSSRGLRR